MRDRVAWRLCNWILRHIASEEYERRVGLMFEQGIWYADVDENAPFMRRNAP